jgi:hypothetical protein
MICVAAIAMVRAEDTAVNTPNKAAVVDLQRIYNTFGHNNLAVLNADAEVKSALHDMNKRMNELLQQLIAAEDPAKIKLLQDQYNTLQQKIHTIRNLLQRSGARDYRQILNTFIRENYSDAYIVIMDKNILTSRQWEIIVDPQQMQDITDQIIDDLRKLVE